jgi:hypothetical protein
VREHPAIELLSHQLRCLTPKHTPALAQMRLDFRQ